jgi:DNA invertase Pin-like site-specific DNA recombinase
VTTMQGHRIGYRRVSTVDQNTARQLDGVLVDKVFEDHCSGKNMNRPQLKLCLEFLREGDTLVVQGKKAEVDHGAGRTSPAARRD